MAINKMTFAGVGGIDLTGDTVVETDVASGKIFHKADGTQATGTAQIGGDTLKELYIDRTLKSYEITTGGIMPSYMFASSFIEEVSAPIITEIDKYAFYNCVYLKNINLPLVTNVSSYAFSSCSSLTTLNFPELITVQDYAFYSCSKINTINLSKVKTVYRNGLASIGPQNNPIENLNLPEVRSLQAYALDSANIKKITFPKLTWLGQYLAQNSLIEELTIPSTIQTIESRALWNMRKLKKLIIEADLTSFPVQLLNNNESMEEIDLTVCTQVPTLGGNYLANLPTTCIIKVPAALETEWKQATNWVTYASQIVGV